MKTDTYDICVSRRTILSFTDQPVSNDLIRLAITAAIRAPNHHMTFPWSFIELGPKARTQLLETAILLTTEKKGAPPNDEYIDALRTKFLQPPYLIAAVQHRHSDPLREKEDYASMACAIQNFSLVLWENGVGSKWGTGAPTSHPQTYASLKLDPEKETIVGILWVGYPEKIPETRRPTFEEVYRQVD